MPNQNILKFQKSITKELIATNERVRDLIGNANNITVQSLSNLKKTNPNKYEVVVLGLVAKKLNINVDDLIFLNEFKNNSEKSLS